MFRASIGVRGCSQHAQALCECACQATASGVKCRKYYAEPVVIQVCSCMWHLRRMHRHSCHQDLCTPGNLSSRRVCYLCSCNAMSIREHFALTKSEVYCSMNCRANSAVRSNNHSPKHNVHFSFHPEKKQRRPGKKTDAVFSRTRLEKLAQPPVHTWIKSE